MQATESERLRGTFIEQPGFIKVPFLASKGGSAFMTHAMMLYVRRLSSRVSYWVCH